MLGLFYLLTDRLTSSLPRWWTLDTRYHPLWVLKGHCYSTFLLLEVSSGDVEGVGEKLIGGWVLTFFF